jgi:hypothetical protein
MPELMRSLVARLRTHFGNRRKARRFRRSVSFSVSLFDPKLTREQLEHAPYLEGATLDLSTSGLGLVVPAIRINERYLTAPDQLLHLLLELPSARIEMQVAAVRYEQLEREEGATAAAAAAVAATTARSYLIGVRIADMSDGDRTRFNDYLQSLI